MNFLPFVFARAPQSFPQHLDVRTVKKSCVHIVNKDYKIIPFETMNLFYRDRKSEYLQELVNSNHL